MIIGFSLAKAFLGNIGILGAALLGGICGVIGALINKLIDKITKEQNKTKDSIIYNNNGHLVKPDKPEPVGFGGWLYLVAIGLVLTFGRSIYYLFDGLIPLLGSEEWVLLTTSGNEAYDPMWKVVIYSEMFLHISLIVLIATIGYMCLKGKKLFKYLMISYLLLNLIYSIIAFFMYQSIEFMAQDSFNDSINDIFRTGVICAIWIPYFLLSKRVKNTYVN